MKMYTIKGRNSKMNVSNIPNAIAFTFIRNYINGREFQEIASSCYIKKLNKQQVNMLMTNIKWLFRNYPGLEVVTMQDNEGNITKYVL